MALNEDETIRYTVSNKSLKGLSLAYNQLSLAVVQQLMEAVKSYEKEKTMKCGLAYVNLKGNLFDVEMGECKELQEMLGATQ